MQLPILRQHWVKGGTSHDQEEATGSWKTAGSPPNKGVAKAIFWHLVFLSLCFLSDPQYLWKTNPWIPRYACIGSYLNS